MVLVVGRVLPQLCRQGRAWHLVPVKTEVLKGFGIYAQDPYTTAANEYL